MLNTVAVMASVKGTKLPTRIIAPLTALEPIAAMITAIPMKTVQIVRKIAEAVPFAVTLHAIPAKISVIAATIAVHLLQQKQAVPTVRTTTAILT